MPDARFLWFRQAELRDELLAEAVSPLLTHTQTAQIVHQLREPIP